MSDDTPRTRRRTVAPEAPDEQDQLFGDLSNMAREAVRSPADPRLDTHLAFLGLSADAAEADGTAGEAQATAPAEPVAGAPEAPRDLVPTMAAGAPELDRLRATVARLEEAATETQARLRQLTFVMGVLAIATLLALIVGIVR